MLSVQDVESGLDIYLKKVVPAMLDQGYHLQLVKGGPDYPHQPEQSHFAHIVNGVFGLSRLIRFLIDQQVLVTGVDESTFRKALAAYTVHEVHKAGDVELLGSSEFSIPLERLREEYKRLGLECLAEVDEHLLRAANVHKRSSHHGDLLISPDPDSARLWLLVRLADAMASVHTPQEAVSSLRGYLADFSPAFAPATPPGQYALYYHRIGDVRGILTNAIHQAVALQLEERLGFYPLLYFATGTLYIGPAGAGLQNMQNNIDDLIAAVAGEVLQALTQGGGTDDAIRDGRRPKEFDFEPYVYAFATVEDLLRVVHDDTLGAKPEPRKALNEIESLAKRIEGLAKKKKEFPADWRDTVEERFGIQLLDPKEHKTFNEHWSRARHYLLYVDTLLRDLNLEPIRKTGIIET